MEMKNIISIYDASGRMVNFVSGIDAERGWDVSLLPRGLYHLGFFNAEGEAPKGPNGWIRFVKE
jgi:hypothetical protein